MRKQMILADGTKIVFRGSATGDTALLIIQEDTMEPAKAGGDLTREDALELAYWLSVWAEGAD